MQGIDRERRREESPLRRLTSNRSSMLAVAGVVVAAAIAFAFVLSSLGDTRAGAEAGATGKSSSTPAIVVPVASPTTASTPTPEAGGRIHEVASGDTLMEIAKKYYGDPMGYEKIFEANRDILKTPDSLQIGQKLRIPE